MMGAGSGSGVPDEAKIRRYRSGTERGRRRGRKGCNPNHILVKSAVGSISLVDGSWMVQNRFYDSRKLHHHLPSSLDFFDWGEIELEFIHCH